MDKLAKTKAAIERKQQSSIQVQQEELYKELLRRGLTLQTEKAQAPPASFKEFVKQVAPDIEWHPFVDQLADLAERIASHELTRVMIWIPPQLGKTTIFSKLLSAYYLLKNPTRKVAVANYGYERAEEFTYDALLYYKTWGGSLDPQSQSKGNWRTDKMGQCRAFGVGGPVLGATWHLGIVDDPHKGPEEIDSEAKRERIYDWWDAKWRTRANPIGDIPACYVVIMQRWSERDLCGWLLSRPKCENWHVACFEAVKEAEPVKLPPNCTLEPDNRKVGEVLWEQRLRPERIEELKSSPYLWGAQYQQRPGTAVGALCERKEFILVEQREVPEFRTLYRAWDTALTKGKKSDYSVGVLFGFDDAGCIWILDVIRDKLEVPDVENLIIHTAETDYATNPNIVVAIEDVPVSKSIIQSLQRNPRFLRIPLVPVNVHSRSGLLINRAAPVFATIRGKRFKVVKDMPWTEDYIEEFLRITGNPTDTDDQVSATFVGYSAMQQFGGGTTEIAKDINPYTHEYVRELVRLNQRTRNKPKQQWRPF